MAVTGGLILAIISALLLAWANIFGKRPIGPSRSMSWRPVRRVLMASAVWDLFISAVLFMIITAWALAFDQRHGVESVLSLLTLLAIALYGMSGAVLLLRCVLAERVERDCHADRR